MRMILVLGMGFLLGVSGQASAQTRYPLIKNHAYAKRLEERQSMGAFAQDTNGTLFIGFSHGLQRYDGRNINMILEGMKIDALAVDTADNQLYIGGYNNFGQLIRRQDGSFEYSSLSENLKTKYQHFGQIRQVYVLPKSVAFYADEGLFIYHKGEGTIERISLPGRKFKGAVRIGNAVLVNTPDKGLIEYKKGKHYYKNKHDETFQGKRIVFSIRINEFQSYIATDDNRIYKSDGDVHRLSIIADNLKGKKLVHGLLLSDYLLMCTESSGCFYLDPETGEPANILHTRTGLEEIDVNAVFQDRAGRVWIAHNQSFSQIYVNLPLNQYHQLSGHVNALAEYNQRLYAATDDGVYYVPRSKEALIMQTLSEMNRRAPDSLGSGQTLSSLKSYERPELGYQFRQVKFPKSLGKVLSLRKWGNHLLIGASSGFYVLTGGQLQKVNSNETFFLYPSPKNAGRIFVIYSPPETQKKRIGVIYPNSTGWAIAGTIPGLAGNFKSMYEDPQRRLWINVGKSFWVTDPIRAFSREPGYKQIYPNPKDRNQLINLYPLRNRLFCEAGGTIYVQDGNEAALKQHQLLSAATEQGNIHLAGAGYQHWLLFDQMAYKFRLKTMSANIQDSTNLLGLLPQVDVSFVDEQGNLWLGCRKQVYKLVDQQTLQSLAKPNYQVFFSSITLTGQPFFGANFQDSIVTQEQRIELPYGTDYALTVSFSAPNFDAPSRVQYLYRDEPSEAFKPLNKDNFLYTVPGPGDYELEFKAVDALGNESKTAKFHISVAQPIWQHPLAYVFYVLVGAGAIYGINRYSQRRIRRRNEQLEQAVQDRTSQLEASKNELEEKNSRLQESLETIEQQQAQLIESEKMAALGQTVAGVAHEINTPMGAVKSAIQNLEENIPWILDKLPEIQRSLPDEFREGFQRMVEIAMQESRFLSTREERQLRMKMANQLAERGIEAPEEMAQWLVKAGLNEEILPYVDYFKLEQGRQIAEVLRQLALMSGSLRNISNSVDKTQKIVYTLKSYAHPGAQSQQLQQVHLEENIDSVLTLYQNYLKEKIEVHKHYEHKPSIWGYPNDLAQVWTNLLWNAIQAMDGEGSITIGMHQESDYIVISFTDNGPGIPEDMKEKIFKPTYTTKPPGEGSGMGLFLSRRIVEQHDGQISVSKPGNGQGTCFTIWLPIQGPSPSENEPTQAVETASSA